MVRAGKAVTLTSRGKLVSSGGTTGFECSAKSVLIACGMTTSTRSPMTIGNAVLIFQTWMLHGAALRRRGTDGQFSPGFSPPRCCDALPCCHQISSVHTAQSMMHCGWLRSVGIREEKARKTGLGRLVSIPFDGQISHNAMTMSFAAAERIHNESK